MEATGHALEAGYRHIDTATAYGNEAGIGRLCLSGAVPGIGVRDHQAAAGSCGPGTSNAVGEPDEGGLDVDLWLVHWPPGGQAAPKVWEQLVAAPQEGLAKAIGVSNYALDQIDELAAATGVNPSVNQIRWSRRSTTRRWLRAGAARWCWRYSLFGGAISTTRPWSPSAASTTPRPRR